MFPLFSLSFYVFIYCCWRAKIVLKHEMHVQHQSYSRQCSIKTSSGAAEASSEIAHWNYICTEIYFPTSYELRLAARFCWANATKRSMLLTCCASKNKINFLYPKTPKIYNVQQFYSNLFWFCCSTIFFSKHSESFASTRISIHDTRNASQDCSYLWIFFFASLVEFLILNISWIIDGMTLMKEICESKHKFLWRERNCSESKDRNGILSRNYEEFGLIKILQDHSLIIRMKLNKEMNYVRISTMTMSLGN